MIVLCALALSAALPGQLEEVPYSARHVADVWTVRDGLPQVSVTDIAEDDAGFLLLSTFGGVARFDGVTFTPIRPEGPTLDGGRFVSVAALGHQVVAGTERGHVVLFDRDASRVLYAASPPAPVTDLTPFGPGQLRAAIGPHLVELSVTPGVAPVERRMDPPVRATVLDDQGRLWGREDDGVRCVSAGCAGPALDGDTVSALRRLGPHLVAVDRRGVWRLAATGWRLWGALPGAADVALDVAGRLWVAGTFGLVELTDAGPRRRVRLPTRHAIGGPEPGDRLKVRVLHATAEGTLWVGSDNEGLFGVRDRGVQQIAPEAGRGLSSKLTVYAAGHDAPLVAGYCDGLQRLGPADRLVPVTAVPPDACVQLIASAQGRGLWLGIDETLQHFADGGIRPVFDGRELRVGGFLSYATLPDTLWFGTARAGVLELSPTPDGLVWVRSWGRDQGLPDEGVAVIRALANGDGAYLGTGGGLVELRAGAVRPVLTAATDRPARIRDILVDIDDTLWAATYGAGLLYAPAATTTQRTGRWLDEHHGFCDDNLSRVFRHPEEPDVMWFNGNRGLFWVDRAALVAFARGERAELACHFVPTGEGNGGVMPAGGIDARGRLLVPTTRGVVRVNPADHVGGRGAHRTDATVIERADVDGRSVLTDAASPLPPGHRDLVVEFATPRFHETRPPQFEVTLVSEDRHIVQRGGPEQRYVGLSPGAYTLTARRRHPDGTRGPPAGVSFVLAPSWTERTVVRLGLPLLGLLLIGLLLRRWVDVHRGRARALQKELDERQAAERARRERDRVYETVFRGSPSPLFLFDARHRLVDRNRAARALVGDDGRAHDGVPGFVPAAHREKFTALLAGDAPEADAVFTGQDGRPHDVHLHLARFSFGGAPHILLGATDLTQERAAERERRMLLERSASAQRLEGLGRLAGGIAHDFNNVLAALTLHTELLVDETIPEEDRQASLDEMKSALEKGKALTNRFMVFGQDHPAADTVKLDDQVRDAEPLLRRLLLPRIELVLDLGAPDAYIEIDPVHVDQLLLNLVVNAQDATLDRGTITIRTRCDDAPRGRTIIPGPATNTVTLSVADQGVGMADEVLDAAFEPFYTLKDAGQGTGLGLTVVHGIAHNASTSLSVQTGPEKGTTVSLAFPRTHPPADVARPRPAPRSSLAAAAQSAAPSLGTPPRILIVDDEPSLLNGLSAVLRAGGCEPLPAASVAAARPLLDPLPDLVLTDFVMPGENGDVLIREVRQRSPDVPLVLLSGYVADPDAVPALPEGVHQLKKPIDAHVLLALVLQLVHERRAADQHPN